MSSAPHGSMRVADVAERRQVGVDARPGGLGDRRQVDARPRREVGDERRLAGRDRHDARPPAPHRPAEAPGAGDELGRLEQLVEVRAADDPGRPECRVDDPVLARERPGVGDRGRLGLMAAAHLDRQDRLADRERVVGEGEEPLGPLEPLDEQDDRVGRVVVEAVGEVVAQVEHHLRAAADDARPADPGAGVDEGVRHAAGLGDAGDAAVPEPGRHVADVGRAPGRQVDHAHAVRPEDGRAGRDPDGADLRLHPGGRLAALHDTAAGDDHGP